ncbi:MAG: ATP-binding cassette domain-containing protein [Planctomycetes bacterium]|nr:ATP-binding cassette domain-containing protein [Planctomycetota bacterium]
MSRLEVNGVEVVSRATGERVAAAPDFVIESGRTTCLLGPSGCGKSLTALAILDLLPPELELSQGRFRLDGQDLDAGQRRALRGRRIGMLFQEPRQALHPDFSVGAQLVEVLRTDGRSGAECRAAATHWLGRVGIKDPVVRETHRPGQFSGGELQRIVCALALCRGPDFLLADEPTSNLDVTVQARILGLLRRLQREDELGLLLVSHDERVVAAMADDLRRFPKIGDRP